MICVLIRLYPQHLIISGMYSVLIKSYWMQEERLHTENWTVVTKIRKNTSYSTLPVTVLITAHVLEGLFGSVTVTKAYCSCGWSLLPNLSQRFRGSGCTVSLMCLLGLELIGHIPKLPSSNYISPSSGLNTSRQSLWQSLNSFFVEEYYANAFLLSLFYFHKTCG